MPISSFRVETQVIRYEVHYSCAHPRSVETEFAGEPSGARAVFSGGSASL